jgi:hypothetical protein
VASEQAAESVKAAHGAEIRAATGVFAIGVQRRAPDDFFLAVFVDRNAPLPTQQTINGVDVIYRHEDRLRP